MNDPLVVLQRGKFLYSVARVELMPVSSVMRVSHSWQQMMHLSRLSLPKGWL